MADEQGGIESAPPLTAYEIARAKKEAELKRAQKQKRKLIIYSTLACIAVIVGLAVVLGYSYS
ncbi:Mth family G-protein coupled receptor [Adlercreutzia sp. ZJ138]|uniref:Mth family G-protein coupled receptor n=1 Tax=Adlercreutzia sp. ZJ138 TaxID=2709405 RepID=UPI0013EBD1EB|nr:Mth family G-protein coupled receptor [Adlercreutzia sp. ZJ138]